MSKLQVQLFGNIKEALSTAVLEVEFVAESTTLIQTLKKKHTKLESLSFQLAVNQEVVDSCKLSPTDELALLPPFSGG